LVLFALFAKLKAGAVGRILGKLACNTPLSLHTRSPSATYKQREIFINFQDGISSFMIYLLFFSKYSFHTNLLGLLQKKYYIGISI
jgi:hypothetical protein